MNSSNDYYFDNEAADRVVRFFATLLHHYEGKHAGKLFELLPWQSKLLKDIYGWKRPDGTRRYRSIWIELPRKQGKSALASGWALYSLCADNEAGAQVYSVAANKEQANITFNTARKMVAASTQLDKRITTKQYHLEHSASQSFYKALSGESVGAHGKNIHFLIVDEVHELTAPSCRDLYDALVTSMGMRTQPMVVHITTAGHGGELTLAHELHQKAVKYLSGEIKPGDANYDDTFYPLIFAADAKDDWTKPEVWKKANPSLGQTVSIDYLKAECVKAKDSPQYENTFKRLYLNLWTEQATRWLDLTKYDKCTNTIDELELEGHPVIIGLDLSQSFDLTASVSIHLLPDKWVIVPRLYIPKETASRRYKENGTPFPDWIENGHIIATDGPTVDYDRVEADIGELASRYSISEVAYDPYNATQLTTHLEKSGLITVPVHQTYLGMNAASKEFERRLATKTIEIADNPCLRWMAANVEVETDRHGNIRPVKPRASGKYAGSRIYSIDGIVATLIAISRAQLQETAETGDSDNEPTIVFIG